MFPLLCVWHLVPLICLAVYLYARKKYSYWSVRGIRGPRPIFPLGYSLSRALTTPEELELTWSKQYGPVYGLYTGLLPTLTISDHVLIKQVLVKDFYRFANRRVVSTYHPMWNLSLFNAESNDWKRLRSITSPAFTTGKLRSMYPLISECIEMVNAYLDRVSSSSGSDGRIDVKSVMAGVTIDVIAKAAFATNTNANDHQGATSPFVTQGQNLFRFSPMKLMATFALPSSVLSLLGVTSPFPEKPFEFFHSLIRSLLKQRKANPVRNGTKYTDLIQLMLEAYAFEEDLANGDFESLTASADSNDEPESKTTNGNANNKTKHRMTENEIIAQCFLFFIGGFETTASTMTFALFELAQNPDLQERLYQEINDKVAELANQDQTSDEYIDAILNNVPYLEAVIKETLRKYPPVVRLERRVTGRDPVMLGDISLDPGVLIEISVLAVHRNPRYYPEPDHYNPERFMPENKHLLVPHTYLPFGDGPRNCVGIRFAYAEAKLCLASLVRRYRFEATDSTPQKLAFLKGQDMMNCFPFELKVVKR